MPHPPPHDAGGWQGPGRTLDWQGAAKMGGMPPQGVGPLRPVLWLLYHLCQSRHKLPRASLYSHKLVDILLPDLVDKSCCHKLVDTSGSHKLVDTSRSHKLVDTSCSHKLTPQAAVGTKSGFKCGRRLDSQVKWQHVLWIHRIEPIDLTRRLECQHINRSKTLPILTSLHSCNVSMFDRSSLHTFTTCKAHELAEACQIA